MGVFNSALAICLNRVFVFVAPALNKALFQRPRIYLAAFLIWTVSALDIGIYYGWKTVCMYGDLQQNLADTLAAMSASVHTTTRKITSL